MGGPPPATSLGKCEVCESKAKSRCAGCFQSFYCSKEHQVQAWPEHRVTCAPIKVCQNDKVGRYYVATRDIKPGEIVLRENPLVVGPSQATPPVCVGCFKELHEKRHEECERCGWPVCRRECQDAPGHVDNECKLTCERGEKVAIKHFVSPHPSYSCLCTLRCLMLKFNDPKKWQKLLELQSHHEKELQAEEKETENVAKLIQRFFKTTKWSESVILNVNGIARINGHEVPLTLPSSVAIYHRASLFEHSCRPNLAKSFSNSGDVIIWAPNAIKANEHLTISYTDVLWGTQARRFHLQQTKSFDCDCERCSDVSEFGSFMSSLNCLKCKEEGALVTPKSLAGWREDWVCNKCAATTPAESVMKIVDHAAKDLSAMDKENEANCTKFLNHYSRWLSKNHFLLLEVKISLAQIIGAGVNGINRVNEEGLKLKANTCRELIEVIEKVAPNEARILGLIKFELHTCYAEWGRRALQVRNVNCKALLDSSVEHCNDAIRYLRNEAEQLPEGAICKQARVNVASLLTMIGGMMGSGPC